MDFGMPAFTGKTLEECAAHCQQLGLQFVEISMDFPEYQPERIDVDRFAGIVEEHGCRVLPETKTAEGVRLSAQRMRESFPAL